MTQQLQTRWGHLRVALKQLLRLLRREAEALELREARPHAGQHAAPGDGAQHGAEARAQRSGPAGKHRSPRGPRLNYSPCPSERDYKSRSSRCGAKRDWDARADSRTSCLALLAAYREASPETRELRLDRGGRTVLSIWLARCQKGFGRPQLAPRACCRTGLELGKLSLSAFGCTKPGS